MSMPMRLGRPLLPARAMQPTVPPTGPVSLWTTGDAPALVDQNDAQPLETGVKFRSAPVPITAGRNKGGFALYFEDPDGITLEFLQPGPGA